MEHSRLSVRHVKAAYRSGTTAGGRPQGAPCAFGAGEGVLPSVISSHVAGKSQVVPAVSAVVGTAKKRKIEPWRFGFAALVTLSYVIFLVFMLLVSEGHPSFGLTAQRDAQGLWRVEELAPAGLGSDEGVRVGDVVAGGYDGEGNAVNLATLDANQSDFRMASTLVVQPASPGSGVSSIVVQTQAVVPSNLAQRLGYALLGLLFAFVGAPVFVKARERSAASAFYLFCVTTAITLAVAPATLYLRSLWLLALLFIILIIWAASFALFFLKFPVKVGKTKLRHNTILASLAVSGLAVILSYLWVVLGHQTEYGLVRVLGNLYLTACVGTGLAILVRSLIAEKSPEVRQQLFLLLGGTGFAVGPTLLLGVLPLILFGTPLVSVFVTGLALGIMPLAFAYAIIQHQMLGIRNLVRRSVVYVILGTIILVAFSAVAAAVGALLPVEWWKNQSVFLGFGLFVFLIALSFGYMQRRVERLVDRYIYHDAYDYKEALLQFSTHLAAEQDLTALASRLVERTCLLMNLSCGVLLLTTQPQVEQQAASGSSYNLHDEGAEAEYDRAVAAGFASVPTDGGSPARAQRSRSGEQHLEPYVLYGPMADAVVTGLQLELAQLGIVVRGVDNSAPILLQTRSGIPSHNLVGEVEEAVEAFEGVTSYLCLPLWTRSYFVGVLCLGGKRTGERFTKDDLSLLSTLGGQAALAIYNAQLFEAREQALLDTISALAYSIEAKDTYTISHCEKITDRAVAVALAMGMPRQEVENIRLGSILHDVGKIGVPDAILNKPSRLTEEEYEIIKQHAQIGARIVQSVRALHGVVPIVRHHQERYDGKGYPDNLSGEEIPLGARIISVVDAYGAMTEDRVYRKALGHERAVEELQRNAGTQFDPLVVSTFIRSLQDQPTLAELDLARSCPIALS